MSAESRAVARNMARATALLAGFAILGAGLVALTERNTRERIAANERAFTLRSLNEIVPADQRTNDMFSDTIQVSDAELLGTGDPVTVYRARRDGEPVAAILRVVAPNGYSGPIRLLVGVRHDGEVAGVRVVNHRETPGLGDAIESDRSDWILGFAGRSLGNPPEASWTVKRDGGAFDQFTGATITPRAVTRAVRDALIYFRAHREELFAATGEGAQS
jgi:electron transport complex protein RnfG